MDATEIVDFIDVAVALPRGYGVRFGVIRAPNVNAFSWAHPGAQFAADAFFHAVLVTV
tara:strand:+ start:365 stop:538 length:174 start_codon:yes stop_codon:yes gene_type:complete